MSKFRTIIRLYEDRRGLIRAKSNLQKATIPDYNFTPFCYRNLGEELPPFLGGQFSRFFQWIAFYINLQVIFVVHGIVFPYQKLLLHMVIRNYAHFSDNDLVQHALDGDSKAFEHLSKGTGRC